MLNTKRNGSSIPLTWACEWVVPLNDNSGLPKEYSSDLKECQRALGENKDHNPTMFFTMHVPNSYLLVQANMCW